MRVFLDTNVVIDFYARREDFFLPASVIIDLAYKKRIDIVVSSLTFVNAFFILRKTYHKEDLYLKLSKLAAICTITKIDDEIIKLCLQKEVADFEDAVQCASAKTSDMDVIVTRNPKHFKDFDVNVQTPSEFLDNFNF